MDKFKNPRGGGFLITNKAGYAALPVLKMCSLSSQKSLLHVIVSAEYNNRCCRCSLFVAFISIEDFCCLKTTSSHIAESHKITHKSYRFLLFVLKIV